MWAGVAAMALVRVRECTPRCWSASLCVHHTLLPCPVIWACTSCNTAASSVGFMSVTASSTISSLSLDMVLPPCRRTRRARQQMEEPAIDR
jgi:hypothetical protein